MKDRSGYDELEFERLYTRLLHQEINAFFCVTANTVFLQREIAEKISERFPPGEVQIVDFGNLGRDFKFSSAALRNAIHEDARIILLVNFQLAGGDLKDAEFLQIFNLSRDALAELPYIFVFMMPLYFRIKIARNAPDFNSFFRYRADFTTSEASLNTTNETGASLEGYSAANKELLEYYREQYNGLKDFESRQAFEILLKILKFNVSLRVLHFAELNRFVSDFKMLLQKYDHEFDDDAFDIAGVFYGHGDYIQALEWYEKALVVDEKTLGLEHPDTAATYNNIALVYQSQGDYSRALGWYERALVIYEKNLGLEHTNTATTYNNIASVYKSHGDYSRALEWYEKVLVIYEKNPGLEHHDAATTYNNIASVYKSQGDYSRALEWYGKAMVIVEKTLDFEHPHTAAIYNNIAGVYESQGDYSRALEWYEKALVIVEKTLGFRHPHTAATYNNIADVYEDQGDYARALEWREKASGANSPP